eukprot:TRINITY_DN9887_c0_g1_i1.p1 TRINITY_DN9887_c0_g1~~TRINITY_DN9887_c0_g1_i1.p1  ORF type:complete len:227 (-),score=17.34 TRINITY_DN9887_c0_g1_i1:22-702(-)
MWNSAGQYASHISLGVLVLSMLGLRMYMDVGQVMTQIQSHLDPNKPYTGAYLIPVYLLFSTIGIPIYPITVIAGGLFGFAWALFWSLVGLLVCLYVITWLSKGLLQPFVLDYMQSHDRWSKYLKMLEGNPRKLNFMFRLSGLTPFGISTYLMGLSKESIMDLCWVGYLGMLPHFILHVCIGVYGRNVLTEYLSEGTSDWLALVVLVVTFISFGLFGKYAQYLLPIE